MKVWITKYALTQGIIEDEAESCGENFPHMIKIKTSGFSHFITEKAKNGIEIRNLLSPKLMKCGRKRLLL